MQQVQVGDRACRESVSHSIGLVGVRQPLKSRGHSRQSGRRDGQAVHSLVGDGRNRPGCRGCEKGELCNAQIGRDGGSCCRGGIADLRHVEIAVRRVFLQSVRHEDRAASRPVEPRPLKGEARRIQVDLVPVRPVVHAGNQGPGCRRVLGTGTGQQQSAASWEKRGVRGVNNTRLSDVPRLHVAVPCRPLVKGQHRVAEACCRGRGAPQRHHQRPGECVVVWQDRAIVLGVVRAGDCRHPRPARPAIRAPPPAHFRPALSGDEPRGVHEDHRSEAQSAGLRIKRQQRHAVPCVALIGRGEQRRLIVAVGIVNVDVRRAVERRAVEARKKVSALVRIASARSAVEYLDRRLPRSRPTWRLGDVDVRRSRVRRAAPVADNVLARGRDVAPGHVGA